MNTDIIGGKLKQLKGFLQEKWGKLTDDDIDQIQGRKDVLVGKLQEKYGYTKERAQQEADEFFQKNEM